MHGVCHVCGCVLMSDVCGFCDQDALRGEATRKALRFTVVTVGAGSVTVTQGAFWFSRREADIMTNSC